MQYVKFGNTGIEVSKYCLGCMDFPVRATQDESLDILAEAIDNGINFLDTADAYDKGGSERVLGKIIGNRRKDIIIATKFWADMTDKRNSGGCSRVHIIDAVEESLRRLQTDYIDLYQVHRPDPNTSPEEMISTLDNLVKQGKIRYWGVSNHHAWQMAYMLGVSALHNWEPLTSIQCHYNILNRQIENETVPFVQKFNVAVMTYGGLAWGVLAEKFKRGEEFPPDSRLAIHKMEKYYPTDEDFDMVEKLKPIAERNNVTLAQLGIAWIKSKSYVTSIILGGSKPKHFSVQYETIDFQINAEDLKEIDEISEHRRYQPFKNQPAPDAPAYALNWW